MDSDSEIYLQLTCIRPAHQNCTGSLDAAVKGVTWRTRLDSNQRPSPSEVVEAGKLGVCRIFKNTVKYGIFA